MRRDLSSASGLARALACRASMVLDRCESTNGDAEAGTALHAFLHDVNALGHDAALARVAPQYRAMAEAIDPADYPVNPEQYAAEVTFAYNLDTDEARELGRNIGRHYREAGLKEGVEIPGTPDVVGLLGDDAVYVGDYKRGGRHVAAANRNTQLRFNALAACRAYGRTRAVVEVIRIFDGETKPYCERATLDLFDLEALAVELRAWREQVKGDRDAYAQGTLPPMVLGDHCTFCPSYSFCEGQTGLIRRAVAGEIDTQVKPERAAEAYALWRQLEKLTKAFEEQIKGYAKETPIPLKDGKCYGLVRGDRTVYDAVIGEPVLAELLGADAAAHAVNKTMTGESLESAVAAYLEAHPEQKVKGAKTALIRQAEGALHQRGALAVVPTGKMIEHKAKPGELVEPRPVAELPPPVSPPAPAPEPTAAANAPDPDAALREVFGDAKVEQLEKALAAATERHAEPIQLYPRATCTVCGLSFVTNPALPREPPTRCPPCTASGLLPPGAPKPKRKRRSS